VASDAVSRTPVAVTGATCVALVLLVAGLHGDGHISDRAAWGAILGLIVAQLALAADERGGGGLALLAVALAANGVFGL
jgi:hypothetical protein